VLRARRNVERAGFRLEDEIDTWKHERPPPRVEGPGVSCCVGRAEAEGLEPPRPCGRLISNQLPYQLDYASSVAVGETGFEPATPASRTQCSTGLSYSPSVVPFPEARRARATSRAATAVRTGRDSNPRGLLTPHDFQSCSLSRSDTCPLYRALSATSVPLLPAERVGFEPTRTLRARRFSKPLP
jgi:hypothetical protein